MSVWQARLGLENAHRKGNFAVGGVTLLQSLEGVKERACLQLQILMRSAPTWWLRDVV
jgi:hypothetical protein